MAFDLIRISMLVAIFSIQNAFGCNYFTFSATNRSNERVKTMETKELEKEFLSMIEEQKRTIYKVCYMYANDQDDLNDLFQETVLNLWKGFPKYRGDSTFNTWVYRIAMNTCITFLRRSNTHLQTVPMTAQMAGCLVTDEETEARLKELYTLINQLGKLERALILLWLEERNYQEMADILGISKVNVGVKLNRIREKLKRMSNS